MSGRSIAAAILVLSTLAGCGSVHQSSAARRANVVRCLRAAGWTLSSADQTPTAIVASSKNVTFTIYPKSDKPPSKWQAAWTSYRKAPPKTDQQALTHCLR